MEMSYQLFNVRGQEVSHHDLQDKNVWCSFGESKESAFVKKYGDSLGVIINPIKKIDKYAPDLLRLQDSRVGDVKLQGTPFFKAQSLYRLDPQYTVVFNYKDMMRYQQLYPEIEIYFWVDWQAVRFEQGSFKVVINPMSGVWQISFSELLKVLEKAPLHSYMQRKFDTQGNAKSSYVINLQDERFRKVA